MFGAKSGPGLSINTSAANTGNSLFGGSSNQPAAGGTGFNVNASASKPASSLFGSQPSNPPAQPPTQNTTGGFGGFNLGQPTNTGRNPPGNHTVGDWRSSFGGLGNPSSQPQPASSLFNTNQPKPSLFGTTQPSGGNTGLGSTLSFGQSILGGGTSTGAKIDIDHLRPTTKYDQLTDQLQNAISEIDTFIVQQIKMSNEVADLLPAITQSGGTINNDVKFVEQKMEELEVGLENDAEDIERVRKGTVEKDAVEAKLAFRQVDRLKMPSQYHTLQNGSFGSPGTTGLNGWWNNPQSLHRSLRGKSGLVGSRGIQLPGDDDPDVGNGPANLVEFFNHRADEMDTALGGYRDVFKEVEEHLASVEITLDTKMRDLEYGRGEAGVGNTKEEKVRNLTFALSVFEKSIYDVAIKVGEVRNDMQDLVLQRLEQTGGLIGRP
ncbi:MAG: hypothetical protein Q9160_000564 [Pyrenula sp. 1 TL-2023]